MSEMKVKEFSLNKGPKKINLKFSKKNTKTLSKNKVSLKYLLSNNPDSKKKLSLLLNRNKDNPKPSTKIIIKKESPESIKDHKQAKSVTNEQLNNYNYEKISSKIKIAPTIAENNFKISKNITQEIISPKKNNHKILLDSDKSQHIDTSERSPPILQMGGTPIPTKKDKLSSTPKNKSSHQKLNKKVFKTNKVVRLDIHKKDISQINKRKKFISKINQLSDKDIKKILIKNNLIKSNSRAPISLMKSILINSVDLGVNLI